jgi:NAD(P)H-dependent FMN reductase
MTAPAVRLLLVSGSTRQGSTNVAALRTALQVLPAGVEAALHEDLVALPAFNPDDDHDPLPANG